MDTAPAYELGTLVRLHGGCGELCSVEAWRNARHGRWYTFRDTEFGGTFEGYGERVREVVARPADA